MAAWRFGGREEDELVFLHDAGLNAAAYTPLLAPLGRDIGVLAPDLRGHGRTRLPLRQFGYFSWNRHRDDVLRMLEQAVGRPVVLAGHGMGATVALLAAGARPDLVRSLCLLDPVIATPGAYQAAGLPGAVAWARLRGPSRLAARQPQSFPGRRQAQAALATAAQFSWLPEAAWEGFLQDGLLEQPGGEVSTSCRPSYLAATLAAGRHDPYAAWRRGPSGMVLLRGEHSRAISPAVARRLADLRPDARIAHVEGAGPGLPLQRPDRARAALETAFVLSGLRSRQNLE
jgi:pimeloyl-ACP methyl ester carboxylesterase